LRAAAAELVPVLEVVFGRRFSLFDHQGSPSTGE